MDPANFLLLFDSLGKVRTIGKFYHSIILAAIKLDLHEAPDGLWRKFICYRVYP